MSQAEERIDKLIGVVEQQQERIGQQLEQIGLLVSAVAMLLGEEMGKPVDAGQAEEGDGIERDWDGNVIG